jgi:hypothetical protein
VSTTDDLRHLVRARADAELHDVDLPRLTARAAAAGRRRRATRVAGAGLATLSVAGLGLAILPGLLPADDAPLVEADRPVPAVSELFPSWLGGGALAQATGWEPEQATAELAAAVPAMAWSIRCDTPDGRPVDVQVEVVGTGGAAATVGERCRPDAGPTGLASVVPAWEDVAAWRELGIDPTQPLSVSVRAVRDPASDSGPGDAEVAIAVYERVPLDEYPAPPAPDPLPTLDADLVVTPSEGAAVDAFTTTTQIGSGAVQFETTMPQDGLSVAFASTVPAEVRVLVDGTLAAVLTTYDYEPGVHLSGLNTGDAAPGEPVVIEFQTSGLPGVDGELALAVAPSDPRLVWELRDR